MPQVSDSIVIGLSYVSLKTPKNTEVYRRASSDRREFPLHEFSLSGQLLPLTCHVGPLGVELRADRHELACGHRHGTRHQPATPATRISFLPALAAATPTIKLAVDTMPSFAPRTAARSQPIRCVRCCSGCRMSGIKHHTVRNAMR